MNPKDISPELKEKIIKEAIETNRQKAVATKYGIPATTIYAWVRAYRMKNLSESNKTKKEYEAQISDLELENKVLKELLKKTTLTLIKD